MGLFDKTPKEIAQAVASGAWSASKAAGKLGLKSAWTTTKITAKVGGKTVYFFVPDRMKNVGSKISDASRRQLCAKCNKPIIPGKKGSHEGDNLHKGCMGEWLKDAAQGYETLYHEDGRNRKSLYDEHGKNKNTNLHLPCGCNKHNIFHNCSEYKGQRTAANVAKGNAWRDSHSKDDNGRWSR